MTTTSLASGVGAAPRCNRRLLYPLRENPHLLLQPLDLSLALLQLALILLQLLLYLNQQVGHIIGRMYSRGPEEGGGEAAMSDRAT